MLREKGLVPSWIVSDIIFDQILSFFHFMAPVLPLGKERVARDEAQAQQATLDRPHSAQSPSPKDDAT
jgi:hypothetical protein